RGPRRGHRNTPHPSAPSDQPGARSWPLGARVQYGTTETQSTEANTSTATPAEESTPTATGGRRTSVALLDYGSGNIRSAQRAIERAGAEVTVTNDPKTVLNADGLLVPGVGA